MAWRREAPDRIEKFFIQSLLRLVVWAGRGGWIATPPGGGNARTDSAPRRTRTYESWKRTAMIPSKRSYTRTIALRIPAWMS
jgi:hypothetical protein